nr:MAG TPA: hypothetical protein [Caudoviricetes sp.]
MLSVHILSAPLYYNVGNYYKEGKELWFVRIAGALAW